MEIRASKRNLVGTANGGPGTGTEVEDMENDGDITTLAEGEGEDGDTDDEMGGAGAVAMGSGTGGNSPNQVHVQQPMHIMPMPPGAGAHPRLVRRPSEIARQRYGYSAEQAGRLANEAAMAAVAQMQLAERLLLEEGLSTNDRDIEGDFKKFSQRIMSGLHSFDLHDSIHYSRLFGFASHVPRVLKRRIDLSTTRRMETEEAGQSMGMHFNQRIAHGQGFDVPMPAVIP